MNPTSNPSDKRTLKRQYREATVPAGVFAIRNRLNGRVYVGASLNVAGAINRHRFELQQRTHRNARLLRDWLDQAGEQFDFEVLDLVKDKDDPAFDRQAELAALLELWQQELPCLGEQGYNLPRTSTGA